MGRLVREHRLTGDIADGPYMRLGRPPLGIDSNETLLVDLDLGLLQAQTVAVRPAADRNQHAAELLDLAIDVALERHFDRLSLFDHGHDLNTKQNFGEILAQLLVQRADQIAIGARQETVGQFHHADARAKGRVDRAHFQADVTAADNQQRLGHVGQFQRSGRVHYSWRGQVEGRYPRGPRTAGKDAVLETDAVVDQRGVADRLQSERPSIFETGLGLDEFYLALGSDLLQPAGERGDDLLLPRPHDVDIDGRLGKGDTPFGQVRGLRHRLGDVQQGLRGDAAAEEARAAQSRFQIDQRDLHAEIGGQKRRGVTTRSAAENNQLGIHGFAHASNNMPGVSKLRMTSLRNRPAVAPSTRRWSKERLKGIISRVSMRS